MSHDLERFITAQERAYPGAIVELRNGRKAGHWIWYIFPQVSGLGSSSTSRYYAITSLDEARAYLADPVLGARLRECVGILLATTRGSADEILGSLDAMKLRSSMTLFHRAAPDELVFRQVLDRYFEGKPDARTDARLALAPAGPRQDL